MMMMMMMMINDVLFLWFPAEAIVRDPHHLESLTRHKQDLNLRRT